MSWTRGARMGKQDHRATAERVLRLGDTLRARAGAGDADGMRGGPGGDGATWEKQGRPARGREGGGQGGEGTWLGAVRRGGGGGATHGRPERWWNIGQRTEEEEGR
jgi:hypothetical protein